MHYFKLANWLITTFVNIEKLMTCSPFKTFEFARNISIFVERSLKNLLQFLRTGLDKNVFCDSIKVMRVRLKGCVDVAHFKC